MSFSVQSVANRAATYAISNTNTTLTAKNTAASPAAASATPASTTVTFSEKALKLMQLREISSQTQQDFSALLQRAQAANAAQDPKAFLSSLNPDELAVLQKVHSLADPIDVASLSNEGASNLLAQPGSEQDLDNNGLTSIGIGNTFTFPPNNAPTWFKEAWASTTEGRAFGDIPPQMILAVGLANLHVDSAGHVTQVSPDDPAWVNPYADPDYDYRGAVSNLLAGLEDQYKHNLVSKAVYENDTAFYKQLQAAMG